MAPVCDLYFFWEEREHDSCFGLCLLLGTSAVAPRGQGRGKSHPIKMEMSWEGPALVDRSCWRHCAYSLANFHKH